MNCAGQDFQSTGISKKPEILSKKKRTTGFLNPNGLQPSSDSAIRHPAAPRPGVPPRPRPPTRPNMGPPRGAPPNPRQSPGKKGHRPPPPPPPATERPNVEVYEPRSVAQLYEGPRGPSTLAQQAPERPGSGSGYFPVPHQRPAAPPEPILAKQNFSAPGPSSNPYLEVADDFDQEETNNYPPSVFSDATAEALAFQQSIENNFDKNDDTSPALQQVSASPLVWSPGSSTQSEYIANRYLIRNPREDLLGTGAKGVVYKAYDTRLGGRKVAVKLFFDAFGDLNDPEIIEEEKNRTQREVEIQGELTHPSIVTIHDRFDSEHGSGVVLEFVDGETLEDRIDRQKVISSGNAVRFAIELTKAVEFMHRHQFIHRDIKPGNVLITRDENVKLIDFGLSKAKHEKEKSDKNEGNVTRRLKLADNSVYKTQEGDIVGTPAYMAPEQASGKLSEVDEVSDVYGLGAILYHCLTGDPPVNKETIEEVLDLVVAGVIPSPRTLNPEVDAALEAIVMKSLARDREDRFPTALSLKEQLILYQDGKPLAGNVYQEPLFQRASRWLTSHQTFAIVIITILVSVSTIVGGIQLYQGETNRLESNTLILDARNHLRNWRLNEAYEASDKVLELDAGNLEAFGIINDINRSRPLKEAYDEAMGLFEEATGSFKRGEKSQADDQFSKALSSLLKLEKLSLRRQSLASNVRMAKLIEDKKLASMIEEARGLIPFGLAPPQSKKVFVGATLQLQKFDKQFLQVQSKQFVDFRPPQEVTRVGTPVLKQKLPLGTYLANISYGERRHLFPIKIERNEPLYIGPLPEPPKGFVYVFARKKFRPGHPRHDNLSKVFVKPFFIQEKEVSVKDYYFFLKDYERTRGRTEARRYKPFHWASLKPPLPPTEWDRPARNISFNSAQAYLRWISKQTKRVHRLPTEAQWQLAASGGYDDRDYPYGRRYREDWSVTNRSNALLCGVSKNDISPFGVYDMGGNVREWVLSPPNLDSKT
ncbi:MAG: bifunctional serine/threonine-protein kinase/formylglycine-generating enzyme family protein, partial [Planctomycetota bacterium]|nr:bifunctional serine/threonine-protein kinase/formylglycine-generating enzyme family protein [Planctomycetota bacterium]